MRRLCAALTAACLLLAVMTLVPSAADYESQASAWGKVSLRALYIQDETRLTSDVNPAFSSDWYSFEIPEAGGVAATCTVNMRGFALSPDGQYSYMGIQHGGGDIVRGMYVMETMTGKVLDFYYRYDGDACRTSAVPFSYPKGIATDTRGYVYVGFTLSSSYNEAYLSIARQHADGTLTEVSEIPVAALGAPGDPHGTKVGINGVDVVEIDGRMLCYVVTNYDHDALYCFDVTNPETPVPNEKFGSNGRVDLSAESTALGGYTLDEALYLDIDPEGNVYLAITATDGRGGVAILTPDGTSCRKVIACDNVYSVELVGNFLLCGARTGGQITVLNRTTGRQVTTLSVNDSYGERITRMQVAHDVLFVCDAGSVSGVSNAIYTGVLSDEGQAFLDAIVAAQNRGYVETETETMTEAETEAITELETGTVTETEEEIVTETETETESAPEMDSTLATATETDTKAEAETDTATESTHESPGTSVSPTESLSATQSASETTAAGEGCTSLAASVNILLLSACARILRKKH